MSNTFQVIDGSILEGGGQILRIASALSAITSKSIQIDKIRQGRSKAGLRPQHLTGVKLVSDMSSAVCSGLTVGSQQVLMSPGPLQIRNIPYSADTGTAGSCVLLAQAALPCALYCSAQGTTTALTRMHLTGGTDAELAPPIGYMQHVLLPMLKRLLAVDAGARLERRGFYPKGGGRVMLEVAPLSPDAGCVSATPLLHAGDCLSAFQMESRGSIEEVRVFSFSGGKEPEETAGLIAEGALSRLSERFPRVSSTTEHDALAKGSGSGAVVVARSEMGCILGASAIGGPRKPALEVGHRPVDAGPAHRIHGARAGPLVLFVGADHSPHRHCHAGG
uniref:RNA 3'-terminal phosphate cyclase (ATP) n=1 Tax=Tetraselmis sp. GSL018 TaxID=582737 RepID=A0A061RXD6_9CHLO